MRSGSPARLAPSDLPFIINLEPCAVWKVEGTGARGEWSLILVLGSRLIACSLARLLGVGGAWWFITSLGSGMYND